MIQLIDATIAAGSFCLQDVSLHVPEGKYAVLMGPTGNGKTTILEAICGLRKVRRGRIFVGGRDVTTWAPGDRGIGYVPQDLALFPTMSVREHLEFALRLRRASREQIVERTTAVAKQLGIADLLNRSVHALSGGEKQRVALGRALSSQPSVLLLDEPLSALDEATREDMRNALLALKGANGVTMLHVTHSSKEADALADARFVINDGRVAALDDAPTSGGS